MKDLSQYLLDGYADARDATPWSRCPMTFDEYNQGEPETAETHAYWRGFDAGTGQWGTDAQKETNMTQLTQPTN